MVTITAAADSHGKPTSGGDQTAKSPADHCKSGSSWREVLLGGGIPGGGIPGGDPSNRLKKSVPSSSVPKPTSSSASSAPMKNPPPPEPVSPSPEHLKAADCSQKSNVAVSNASKSVWKKPFSEVSAPAVDESTWPALGQLRKKSPVNSPKHPAGGVSVVKEASKVSDASSSRENRNVKSDFHADNMPPVQQESSKPSGGGNRNRNSSVPIVTEIAPKNTSNQTPSVLEPSSTENKLMAGSSGDPLAVSDQSNKKGSSSCVKHSSVPLVHEIAPKNTSNQAPNALEPSSSKTKLMAGSSGDSLAMSDKSNKKGSSSLGANPVKHSSVPLVHEKAPKNTSNQTPDVLEPSSSKNRLMAGSSGDSPVATDNSNKIGSSRRRNSMKNARRWGTRRDNDRGPRERNNSTVSSARGTNVPLPMRGQQRGHGRSTPPGNRPLLPSPPPLRPYGSPLFHPYATPSMYFIPRVPAEYFSVRPFPRPPPPILPPPYIHHPALLPGNTLPSMIVEQIDFYFSEANLIKDEFLRSKMDDEGWVPVSLIASFPRVKRLTTSIPMILDSLRASYVVEVQDNKIRKRHGWRRWISHSLPHNIPTTSGHNDDRVAANNGAPTEKVSLNSDVSMFVKGG